MDYRGTSLSYIHNLHYSQGVAKGPNKENDVLDLTVLAPESKQAVKKGWVPENGKDSSATAKELLHKIHGEFGIIIKGSPDIYSLLLIFAELKTFVREFEASFVDQHGRKVFATQAYRSSLLARLRPFTSL